MPPTRQEVSAATIATRIDGAMRVAHDEIVVGSHPRDVAPNDATTAYTRFILKEGTLGRLVMVSNRVGSSLKSNQGGLATALVASLGKREVLWFGWSGEVTDGVPAATEVQSEGRLTRMLVDLERNDYEGYYTGFANRVLWPLFHYRVGLAEYNPE